jgi:hypothetical protein
MSPRRRLRGSFWVCSSGSRVRRTKRIGSIAIGLVLNAAAAGAADRQVRPFIGTAFAGDTTFVDLENAAGSPHVTVGVSMVVLGDVVGVDIDLGHSPRFFQAGNTHLVLGSSVTTFTGNVVIAAPRRLTEYTLRPYFVGGAGMMHVRAEDYFGVLEISAVLPAIDLGAGAIGFLTNRVGVSWEVRRFQTIGDRPGGSGISFGPERLSFWRATAALVVRY